MRFSFRRKSVGREISYDAAVADPGLAAGGNTAVKMPALRLQISGGSVIGPESLFPVHDYPTMQCEPVFSLSLTGAFPEIKQALLPEKHIRISL